MQPRGACMVNGGAKPDMPIGYHGNAVSITGISSGRHMQVQLQMLAGGLSAGKCNTFVSAVTFMLHSAGQQWLPTHPLLFKLEEVEQPAFQVSTPLGNISTGCTLAPSAAITSDHLAMPNSTRTPYSTKSDG